jgi:hypothetical protein
MEALIQRKPAPGLDPVPEVEPREGDERQATADKQQADEQMPQGEEFVQHFHASVLGWERNCLLTTG